MAEEYGVGGDREEEAEKAREVYCKNWLTGLWGAGKSKIHGMGQQAAAGREVAVAVLESSIYRPAQSLGVQARFRPCLDTESLLAQEAAAFCF